MKPLTEDIVMIRGGGDLATGVIQKFVRAGIQTVVLETPRPTAIRRTVALCEAVYHGTATVEDITARLIDSPSQCGEVWERGEVPLLADPDCSSLHTICPDGLVDAVLAKRNLGTSADMARIVIAMGPGFTAPQDAHAVVETMRGHSLGKVIFRGSAIPNTGIPGLVGGRGRERVIHAPCSGTVCHHKQIGDIVKQGEPVFSVGGQTVTAPFQGLLRGLIREGIPVPAGMKAADIDPRADSDWHSISDKARCIGGGVLEAYLYLRKEQNS